jgi:hypothetical protein
MIEQFLKALYGAGVEVGWRETADALWLAEVMTVRSPEPGEEPVAGPLVTPPVPLVAPAEKPAAAPLPRVAPPVLQLPPMPRGTTRPTDYGAPLGVNTLARKSLPDGLDIGRALRRFGRRRMSSTARRTDVEATIERYCETKVLVPVTVPAYEGWFHEVVLVVDDSATMVVWEATLRAFAGLLKHHPAFGRVTRWTVTGHPDQVWLVSAAGSAVRPSEIVHPERRQLVLVVTDGTEPLWSGAAMLTVLRKWGHDAPLVLIQMLDPRQWPATALGEASASVVPTGKCTPNSSLLVQPSWWWAEDQLPEHAAPIISMNAPAFDAWTRMVMTGDRTPMPAVLTDPRIEEAVVARPTSAAGPRDQVEKFRATVSQTAVRLATLLSAVEVTLPVAELLLDTLVADGRQVHLAEVLASGLLDELPSAEDRSGGPRYEFAPGIRHVLQEALTTTDAFDVWRAVAPYLELATGRTAPFSRLVTSAEVETPQDGQQTRLAAIVGDLIERMGLRGHATTTRGPLPTHSAAAVVDRRVDEALSELKTPDSDAPRPAAVTKHADPESSVGEAIGLQRVLDTTTRAATRELAYSPAALLTARHAVVPFTAATTSSRNCTRGRCNRTSGCGCFTDRVGRAKPDWHTNSPTNCDGKDG